MFGTSNEDSWLISYAAFDSSPVNKNGYILAADTQYFQQLYYFIQLFIKILASILFSSFDSKEK